MAAIDQVWIGGSGPSGDGHVPGVGITVGVLVHSALNTIGRMENCLGMVCPPFPGCDIDFY